MSVSVNAAIEIESVAPAAATVAPPAVFVVHCGLCGRPLAFPFKPKTGKHCESCYSPRDQGEIGRAEARRLTRKTQREFERETKK